MADRSEQPGGARRYRIGEVLGRGGFGTVYRAELLAEGGFSRPVAIKILHDGAEGRLDPLARLRDEARMLGLVRHRAIVTVDALVRLEDRWAVVMELVPGVSLDEALRYGELPVRVVAEALAEVAEALDAAWRAQIEPGRPLKLLHRDIKPSNVLVGPDGEVKLLDFGVARAEFDTREAETRGVVYGSRPYLSPERLELCDTPAGDVFALGIALCELVTGLRPGPAVVRPDAHTERTRPLLAALSAAPGGRALRPLLESVLAYEAERRPDAASVASALRALAEALPEQPHLRDWAAEQIPAVLVRRRAEAGELTGRSILESSGAEAPQRQEGAPSVPSADATFAWTSEALTPTAAAGTSTAAPPAPPPAVPRTGSRVVRFVAGSLALSGGLAVLGGVGLLALLALLTIGLLWTIGPEVGRAGCVSMVDEMRTLLDRASGEGSSEQVRAILHRSERSCATGEVGMLGTNRLLMHVQSATADGTFDEGDLEILELLAAEVLGGA